MPALKAPNGLPPTQMNCASGRRRATSAKSAIPFLGCSWPTPRISGRLSATPTRMRPLLRSSADGKNRSFR